VEAFDKEDCFGIFLIVLLGAGGVVSKDWLVLSTKHRSDI